MFAKVDVSGERVDPERLAAFLDGTASLEERDAVIRALANSPEAYADFLEASAIYRELTGDPGSTAPVEPAAPSVTAGPAMRLARRRWFLAPLALAAGLAAVMVIRRPTSDALGPTQLVQATGLTRERGAGGIARVLGNDWDRAPWSVVRGAEVALPSRPLAFRAGVRSTELELAAQVSDSTAVVRAADAIVELLGSVEAGAAVASNVRGLVRRPDFGGPAGRAQTARQTRLLLGEPDWFDLGAWAEAGRLALMTRNTGFFAPDSPASRELRRIVEPHVDGTSADGDWRPVIDATGPLRSDRPWTPNDIPALEQIVRAVISAAAG